MCVFFLFRLVKYIFGIPRSETRDFLILQPLYCKLTCTLILYAFRESIGSVRGFRARFASQLVQFGASERVSRVNWFSSELQSAFRESIGSVRSFRAHFASQLV